MVTKQEVAIETEGGFESLQLKATGYSDWSKAATQMSMKPSMQMPQAPEMSKA